MRIPSLRKVRQERAFRSLEQFFYLFWAILNPGVRLKPAWLIGAIAAHLEAVSAGDIRRLIINVPPRHLKSTITGVMWPAWEWLHRPERQFLTASHDLGLATRDARYARDIMLSEPYQEMVASRPVKWDLKTDQNVKTWYENTQGGLRSCVSVRGSVTGKGGNIGLIDDPHDAKKINSDKLRLETLQWHDQAFSSRLNNPESDPKVIIMQRLHTEDLCGHVLKQGGWDHVCLPTLYEPDHPTRSKTYLQFVDPRKEPGEMLAPDHFGEAAIAEAQTNLQAYGFAGQHQQRPAPKKGAIFPHDAFMRYRMPPSKFDFTLMSWDCATKGVDAGQAAIEGRSYAHASVWGFVGAQSYLLDERRGQWTIDRIILEMRALRLAWPAASKILIEDKANGPAVMQLLKKEIPGLHPVEPRGSKAERALVCAPFVSAGNVFVPDDDVRSWVKDWLFEVSSFPNAANDDRIDTMTQALAHVYVSPESEAVRRFMTLAGGS